MEIKREGKDNGSEENMATEKSWLRMENGNSKTM